MNNNIFRRHRTSLSIAIALVTSAGLQVAHAGAGWGDNLDALGNPFKVPTYYANSPSGLLDEYDAATNTYVDCFTTQPPASGAFNTANPTTPASGVPAVADLAAGTPGTCDTGTALRKFVDTLPGLNVPNNLGNSIPVATADKATYPGSDYYEIAVVEYMQKMHSDLPTRGTRLRGYVQISATGTVPLYYLNADGSQGSAILLPNGQPAMAMAKPSYLGPIISSTTGTPTRLKFYNLLPAGSAGNLHLPVDETITGAGTGPTAGTKYQQNRVEIHLHGGDNPWISDGTPHQWILPAADETALKTAGHPEMARGVGAKNVPDMPDPGPGAMTYYFPNGESSRLMFYHDHTVGLTRLNVYAGVAAGYLLNDKPNVGENHPALANLLPAPADQIPLVIQDKTFVPKNIAIQDAKWDTATMGQEGDLWYPHVYETNQDPNSFDGTNPVGRWDWGNWFWPVFPSVYDLPTGQITGVNATTGLSEVTTTPEAFMDTAVVNGTAYPTLNVEPKAYRFRILNGANDRFLNLGLYLAADKHTTDAVNPTNSANTKLCSGMTLNSTTNQYEKLDRNGNVVLTQSDCTEVKMVTFDPTAYATMAPSQAYTADGTTSFPTTGGVTGTGWGTAVGTLLPQGAPDPATAGPHIVQIGNEGGLLANPLDIPSTPLNYEYNKRSVTVLNVLERGLFLGNAERADVLIDFTNYAGKTLIMYNDAPAPVPASDPRIDYYTGSGDQTGQGGSANVKPGYGPNTRTIMQIVVGTSTTGTVKSVDMTALGNALPVAYASTQAKPIIPEPEYNKAFAADPAYTAVAPAARYNARIYTGAVYLSAFQGVKFNTPDAMTYLPAPTCTTTATCATALATQLAQPNNGLVTAAAGTAVNAYVQSKAIQELFDPAYGRMNATLGVELPFTSALTQTTIPLGYVDPTTETIADGETQFWKITHNGVDTHPVHFHLVNLQVINRIGWDGTVKPPYGDETGWKETIKMHPLEDVVVAVRAKKPSLQGVADATGAVIPSNAFGLPTSSRLMDPSQPAGSAIGFTQIDPTTGTPAVVTNAVQNFGWEYVWHCHILGHEENDFMRPVVFNANEKTPAAPTLAAINGNVLTWTDNATTEYAYKVERAPLNNGVVGVYADLSTTAPQSIGAAPLANAHTFTDTTALTANTDYRYRITAIGAAGNASTTVDLATAPTAPVLATPTAITATGATLTWTQVSTNVTGFQVWQVGGTAPLATLAKTVKTYNVAGLTASTAYQFYVTAVNGALTTQSNTVSATTIAAAVAGAITAPTAVSIQRTSATAATLSFTDASTNEKTFQVQTSTNGTTWTNVTTAGGLVTRANAAAATSTGTVLNATITVANTTNASYRVVATSMVTAPAVAQTATSAVVTLNNTVAPAAAVLNVPTKTLMKLGTVTLGATVNLSWTDVANNNATYTLQRSTNNGTTWTNVSTTLAGGAFSTTQTILGTTAATNLYRIQAVNSVGTVTSNTVTIVTP